MNKNFDFLSIPLRKREEENAFRQLTVNEGMVDFCSNDYLGFSHLLEEATNNYIDKTPLTRAGATGSRLISGTSKEVEELEEEIASYHNAEAGLIFNSGYDANLGIFSCIAKRGDTIVYDQLAHASIRDGMRLANSHTYSFLHNNMEDLESKLKRSLGTIFVAVESVYSMDGDFASLEEIAKLCKKYSAHLIVDEAHATGIYGKHGEGRVVDLNLEEQTFIRLHTFGKALGTHGAIVLGPKLMRDFLINFSRPFIYSTALPMHSLAAIKSAYQLLRDKKADTDKLFELIHLFRDYSKECKEIHLTDSISSIQGLIYPGNARARALSKKLQAKGFDVRAILSPTVPAGEERLRVCLHTFNTKEEVKALIKTIISIINEKE